VENYEIMTRLVHIGDCHLGYRQYGLPVREEDFRTATEYVVNRAIALKANAFIWPGDVFDSTKPSATNVRFLQSMVERLSRVNIVSIGVDGNHDFADRKWLEICGMLTFTDTDWRPINVGGVNIFGFNYTRPALLRLRVAELVETLTATGKKADVIIMHQAIAELTAFGSVELPMDFLAGHFAKIGVKYVALGDIHDYRSAMTNGIWFIYPGSVEVTDLNESHDKLFLVVDFDAQGNCTTALEPIPTRPILQFNVAKEADLEVLATKLDQAGNKCLAMIQVNGALFEGCKRVREKLAMGGVPNRVSAYTEDAELDAAFTKPPWERESRIFDLHSAVEEFYPKGSDEYSLILQCLATDDLEPIITNYLTEKGVSP
jgi:DNA repair exonuclease SbcCD nuclease subunit